MASSKGGPPSQGKRAFRDSGLNITSQGRPYLGAPLGTEEYSKQQQESLGVEGGTASFGKCSSPPTTCGLRSLYTWLCPQVHLPVKIDPKQ